MYDLIIKNAKLVDNSVTDIAIKHGKIVEIDKNIIATSSRVLDLQNQHYISAGWIDSHTHCFAHSPIYEYSLMPIK
ncbi:hypothetical protein GASC598I20_001500 [Gilliamella apicola SCGC AB-598-I20]|nr:hypothetical protein GASC598I20_001500 [Gilliamella apicola SCGC AB-598-I20]